MRADPGVPGRRHRADRLESAGRRLVDREVPARHEHPPVGTRAAADGDQAWAEHATERTWRIVETVGAVAGEVDRTPAQVALRWLVQQPGVTAAIVGARSLRQLEDNLGASGWALSEDRVRRLTEASERPLPYPYELQRLPQFQRRASTQAPW